MKRLVKLALIVGAVAVLAKVVATEMAKWQDLSESEVRDKLDSKLPKFVPDDKRAEIADEVVSGMRERGALRDEEEPTEDAPTDSDDAEASELPDDVTASV